MMKRKWEQCPHSEEGTRWSSVYVTMNPAGYISLSKLAYRKLGEPEKVLVLYERSTNTIGLQPSTRLAKGAFRVCSKGSGGRVIRALRLMQEFNIKLPLTVRFMDPEFDQDGVLVLDLNNTRPARKGSNGRATKAEIN